jgi:hypothetical protein
MESMKRRRSLPWLILTLVTGLLSLGFAGPATSFLPAQGQAALAQLKERGLYNSLQDALATARYGVYPEPRQLASWQAENPAQQMRARFTPEGVEVEAKSGEGAPRRLGMKLRSVGYGERAIGVTTARMTTSGSRIEYRRSLVSGDSAAGAITEWFVNTAAGLEQGFTLESAPGGRQDGERLRVVLGLESDLRAQAVDGGQALEFTDGVEQRVLRYDHLVVRDGEGRELEARMEVRIKGGEGQLWLEVDDRTAVWPVTIDPTLTQQQKLEAADAASNDNFGRSVAISGETVAVGAPNDDGAAGLDQGSVCVFVRSGGGWSQQQKLLAADAELLDDFGWSVVISGETLVVGTPSNDGFDHGSAYVFVRNGEVWNQQQKLLASDPQPGDEFGDSVALSGETVVVGAPNDDGAAGPGQGSAYVFGAAETPSDIPPTITLKAPISLWPPNHKYRTVDISQMVQSASDPEDDNVNIKSVVIEKVTSDESDDAPGGRDGNTDNDIVIASDCKSVQLRSERHDTKNGRVYSITLWVADSAGNVTREEFKVSVPLNRSGVLALEDPPALTITSG